MPVCRPLDRPGPRRFQSTLDLFTRTLAIFEKLFRELRAARGSVRRSALANLGTRATPNLRGLNDHRNCPRDLCERLGGYRPSDSIVGAHLILCAKDRGCRDRMRQRRNYPTCTSAHCQRLSQDRLRRVPTQPRALTGAIGKHPRVEGSPHLAGSVVIR